jgi:hypothetical protein
MTVFLSSCSVYAAAGRASSGAAQDETETKNSDASTAAAIVAAPDVFFILLPSLRSLNFAFLISAKKADISMESFCFVMCYVFLYLFLSPADAWRQKDNAVFLVVAFF